AGRGARSPAPGRAGPGGHHRRRTHRLRRAVPGPAAPAGPVLRGRRRHADAAALHLRLAPGTGAHRPGRPAAAPAAVLDPAGTGQAEVPGRLGVRDGSLDLRHQPGEDSRPAERGGGTVTTSGTPGSTVTMLDAWDEAEGARRARALFTETFDGAPDGVWSAPGRVNLIGEHTDYNGGLCLPIALEHRTFVALRRRPDDQVHLVSEREGSSWQVELADVAPGAVSGWGAYPVGGSDAAVAGCVPCGAGLSSAAALECAFAMAFATAPGWTGPDAGTDAGRAELAAACVRAENEIAGANTGGMDQAASLRSRAGHALLLDTRDGHVEQI